METMYLPVYKAGENEFVITSYEAVFKSEKGAIDNAQKLLRYDDLTAPAEFERVLVVKTNEGIDGVNGNFVFLNFFFFFFCL